MNDYRSISLLPVFSKIFEKIIAERLMSFIDKNSNLTSCQFGFRTSSLTELAVTSIYDEQLQHLNDNKLTCSIFLDLRKAFVSVDHSILLKKLNHYGFRGNTLKFFEFYLKNRKILPNFITLCRDFTAYRMVFHEDQSLGLYCFYCM